MTRSWWPGEQEEKGTPSMGQHAVQMQVQALDDALWGECSPMPRYPPTDPQSWVLVPLADQPSLQVVELQQTLAQKDQVLGKLEHSLRLMEEASFDGTFLWKITNVTKRCHESVCGRTVSLFSPGDSFSWPQRLVGETGPRGPGRHGVKTAMLGQAGVPASA